MWTAARYFPARSAGMGNQIKTGRRIRREASSRAAVKGSGRPGAAFSDRRARGSPAPGKEGQSPVPEGSQERDGGQGAVADGRRVQDGPGEGAGSMAPRLSTETRSE